MGESIRIRAKNRDQVIEKAKDEFGPGVKDEELEIELLEEKKGFLGLGGNKKIYRVEKVESAEDEADIKKRDENVLEMAESINLDGDFRIIINDEGIYLKVDPPEGEGKPVSFQKIKKKLDEKGIVEYNEQIIQEAIYSRESENVKIAERKPELDRDGEIQVEIGDKGLKAFISYFPARGGEKLTADDFYQSLEDAGITYGIKDDKIKDLLKYREEAENVLIAEGEEPVPGKDGELIYHFEEDPDAIGTEREDGSIDFYDLGLINNVEPGDVLVTRREPVPGEAGMSVCGEEIAPAKPGFPDLPSGKNVEKTENDELIASIKGQVVKDGKRVNVLPVYEVTDVDLSTGNIDFVGNVKVKGNVEEGLKVKADGDVEVRGNVSAARIEASGDVTLHKGFIGQEKGEVKAGGSVHVRFVENGKITAEGDIIVTNAVMHSKLEAGGVVRICEKKGLLVGGVTRAGKEIEANIIGSTLATDTTLEVGIRPEIKERMSELETKIEDRENDLLKARRALKILNKIKEKTGKLPSDKERMYYKLINTEEKLEKVLPEYRQELSEIRDKISKLDRGRIKVNNKVFPGTKLFIGRLQYNVHEEVKHTAFVKDTGEIRKIPL